MSTKILKAFLFVLLLCGYTYPQFYSFGRNKVQYDKFNWKVLKTEHFDIYYYNETEEIAELGAEYAEAAYQEFKVKLNHLVLRRIPLIFYNTSNHFQQTNTTPGFIPEGVGGFFEFLKGRVVIPHTGVLKDFKHVIRHELAHVFMTNKIYTILNDRRMPADALPPLWFVEGFAEYMSTTPDDQAAMVMRDAIFSGYFTGLENMFQVYGTFIMYKEGESFLHFVEEKYGEEKIYQLIDNFWMFLSFDKIIEYTFDKKIEDVDKEWENYLKEKYFPLYANRKPLSSSRQLTKEGFNFAPVYYKNNNEEVIYYQANNDGYSSIYKVEYDSSLKTIKPKRVLQGEKEEALEAFHLFQSGIDISKNGLLAFITKAGATDAVHFYDVNKDEIINRFQKEYLISISNPKFSKNGDKITFQAVDQKGFSDIYIYILELDSLIRLTNDPFSDQDPIFSDDENVLIFSSDRTQSKHHNMYTLNLQSLRISSLFKMESDCTSPLLSGSENKIYFLSDIDEVKNLFTYEIGDDSISQVTTYLTSISTPSIIDSNRIIFTGFEKISFQLYEFYDSLNYKIKHPIKRDEKPLRWLTRNYDHETKPQKLNYEKEYTLDYAQSQVSTDPVFGTRGGAVFSLSDLFSNDNYFFLIYNTADVQSDILKSFNVAIQRYDLTNRTNYGYGIFHFSGRRYDIQDSDEYYFERSYGGFFQLNFPLSKFQRIEASVTVANSDKEVLVGIIERKALLVSNSIAYVHDNSIWAGSGPIDGIRFRLMAGYTSDVKYSNVNYYSLIGDYRQYFRLGLRSSLAFRTSIFYNEGKESRRYFMGGSWDLRGWPRWGIRGEKLWFSSLELRFPMIDQIMLRLPFVNLGFGGLRGALFVDAGSAWDTKYKSTLGSIGGGIRFNFLNAVVFRYDIGKKIEQNFTKLQSGLFYQFFFGWDF